MSETANTDNKNTNELDRNLVIKLAEIIAKVIIAFFCLPIILFIIKFLAIVSIVVSFYFFLT